MARADTHTHTPHEAATAHAEAPCRCTGLIYHIKTDILFLFLQVHDYNDLEI